MLQFWSQPNKKETSQYTSTSNNALTTFHSFIFSYTSPLHLPSQNVLKHPYSSSPSLIKRSFLKSTKLYFEQFPSFISITLDSAYPWIIIQQNAHIFFLFYLPEQILIFCLFYFAPYVSIWLMLSLSKSKSEVIELCR